MNTYDFSPLWRSTVGFDRLVDLINNPPSVESYPPYDIVRTGSDTYRIALAVAGFSLEDISITAQPNALLITGKKSQKPQGELLYQGISTRGFERRFSLADHVEVTSATLQHGLLQIDLVRKLPEAMKPRRIEISSAAARSQDAIPQDNASNVKQVA